MKPTGPLMPAVLRFSMRDSQSGHSSKREISCQANHWSVSPRIKR
ncbi:hypothetical protein BURPS1106B_1360 [Burkholderia pseudomallei 1106b]|uniref:Uncharacterized protein n=2 Tax=Burkholderia pseudomallei TaxID=28450 RepID=A0A0E1VXW5_BURPE|nr:hypothetical protein BURPS668_A0730 [Burkholderia pseudomallei 668]ABN94604.1 hypothetical protein BURPS1106A_A0638 [Burkholderia pseudomallei 1106a]EBA45676.1 hypothetical protein BURPS305_7810 [Burkholderia pseudomallei 305]EEC32489.1 conserved hypothetical protein [Burkholderia pseudomallei 576]EEH27400.1 conserved hypothetical protein [Burkholderia pseudomallei Pakistan 9]EEP49941.1 conserved hypothetical protein [Burkholderia pseudomallei MSHR346]EES23184.1 hypothetical protein BURPS1